MALFMHARLILLLGVTESGVDSLACGGDRVVK